jgi:hypothetical protein
MTAVRRLMLSSEKTVISKADFDLLVQSIIDPITKGLQVRA